MRCLVLGGSRFVGRHIVEALLARGDQVTVFHRGQSVLPPWAGRVERRLGDRRVDLQALAHGTWDVVVDTCGYIPSEVRASARCLKGRVGHYLYISSVSAYADATQPNDETAALGQLEDEHTEVVDGRTYGPLKALCEQALLREWGPEHCTLIRPGLVVGPHDPTQRFTWWPARVSRAQPLEPIPVPGTPDDPVQFIDARDLATFAVHLMARAQAGVFNAVTPAGDITFGALLEACAEAAGVRPTWVWASPEQLAHAEVRPWVDMPVWLPPEGEYAAFMRVSGARAAAAGLRIRPMVQTVADTLAWWQGLPPDQQAFTLAGLRPEREAQLLAGLLKPTAAA
ncbi:NAD-dependent epimerase/dehydratase family protein [Ideonella paludis]|uniref:NAD-dependent epimerase/dehydratase family protein n=1 Tax=Ideonella paludis TaxID=1233411 RepID=A0ABS5DVT4_9BURK|nr:NAD-dependent epimerase/dehydratase family protein [Ideonella paludis]MBQ0935209.1 NAD-dependent epimerase/dehydratase family protein [Ideonella paludis]